MDYKTTWERVPRESGNEVRFSAESETETINEVIGFGDMEPSEVDINSAISDFLIRYEQALIEMAQENSDDGI